MEKEKLLDCVAPCSLLCYACPSFIDGPVSECARRLHNYWDGFCEFKSKYLSEKECRAWHSGFKAFDDTLIYLECLLQ